MENETQEQHYKELWQQGCHIITVLEQQIDALEADNKCRDSIKWFSQRMEDKLTQNDHKGGWHNCSLQYLSMRLTQERKELTDAIESKDAKTIINECADIANFALMIADKFGNKYGK